MVTDLGWPFGELDGFNSDDIRETAYEIFFAACRSLPGFAGRNNVLMHYYLSMNERDGGRGGYPGHESRANNGVGMAPTSRMKRALGLKMLNRSPSRRIMAMSGDAVGKTSSPLSPGRMALALARARRPLTSAEMMRQQMRVPEQSENRLRRALTRIVVSHTVKRAEMIILPVELLRHVKPSEFSDSRDYHAWQRRQLKVLELGLLLHPSVPLKKSNAFALRLKNIILATETKPIDVGKNSDTMRSLCNSAVSLSWRSANGTPADVCHWVDGFPVNIHLYIALLQSIFDIRDETVVLDEVDELLELMKKTWSTLGITRPIHNVCLTWVLFRQYVATMQVEPDLLSAAYAMLSEVASDAKKLDRDASFLKVLSLALTSIRGWSETQLLDYHHCFENGTVNMMDDLIPLALTTMKILREDAMLSKVTERENGDAASDPIKDHVDDYIRSSLKNAFAKIAEIRCYDNGTETKREASKTLIQLADETEELALRERDIFTPALKKWHPSAVGVASVTLHGFYGVMLKEYLTHASTLSRETIGVLQRAGKLEKVLVQMVVEGAAECDDGGKMIVRDIVPYEVDSTIRRLRRQWIDAKLKIGRDFLHIVTETETWNPKSKTELYAQSAVELIKFVRGLMDEFLDIQVEISDGLVEEIADSLESLFQDYIRFVAACGSSQNYTPALPPIKRCHQDSRFIKFCKKVSPCRVVGEDPHKSQTNGVYHNSPLVSRGTNRLYIRLNTLHYLLGNILSLDKTLSHSCGGSQRRNSFTDASKHHDHGGSYFQSALSSIDAACQHVSEVVAYRVIFVDCNDVFYDSLYIGGVARACMRPTLVVLTQSLTQLCGMLADGAQPLAIKEIMKAAFEAYLVVLLAGGNTRLFQRSDHHMIEQDFESLKRLFCTSGEGLIVESSVEAEAEKVEAVIALMGQSTEKLIEDVRVMTDGMRADDIERKIHVPSRMVGSWCLSEPNTTLRVLCHRNDRLANRYLKKIILA